MIAAGSVNHQLTHTQGMPASLSASFICQLPERLMACEHTSVGNSPLTSSEQTYAGQGPPALTDVPLSTTASKGLVFKPLQCQNAVRRETRH
jgi:hypothetical protein